MVLNILINGITLDEANITPLSINLNYWQKNNCHVTIIGNKRLKKNIEKQKIVSGFNYTFINENSKIKSNLGLIVIGIKRNLLLIKNIKSFINKYSIIYCRSSVLDLLIFPYFLKIFDNKIKWSCVFDNTVSLNGPGNRFYKFLAFLFFKISLFLLKKADIIFVISSELKDYLTNTGLNSEKIIVTGNAVEKELINKAPINSKYNFDGLYVGRINPAKGIYDLLKILTKVKKKLSNFQLAIMGEGDKNTKIQFINTINKLKLQKNIKFLGYKTGSEKFSIIKTSKTFWFFSHNESFGIALLEAVCCGKPSFAYQLPAYKNIYKNNEVYLFETGDINAAANKIINIFKNKSFSNNNGKKLIDNYDWNIIAKKELETFQKTI